MLTVRNVRPEPETVPWLHENLTLIYGHALFAVAALCVAALGHGVGPVDAFSVAQVGGGLL
jgi:hypothetical protein